MKVLHDPLGRQIDRLYFKAEVLDERCERKIADFMERHGGGFRLPIPTSEIIRMIVAEAGALDLYADLPEGVDGYTDYFTDRNPEVKISQRLAATRYHNRLRFTLAHEYGHLVSRAAVEKIRTGPDASGHAVLDLLPRHHRQRP